MSGSWARKKTISGLYTGLSYTERKERPKKEGTKARELTQRACLGHHKMNKSLNLPTRILKYIYIYSKYGEGFFFFFLQLHLQHMEVPRPGVKLEQQQRQCHSHSNTGSKPHHNLWQCKILNPLSQTRDQTLILRNSVGSLTC